MNKLVSVVITTYGERLNLLKEAVNSVENQTYKDIEIIIIDDNNPNSDNRLNNINFFSNHPNIKVIFNDENSGAQISRNKGILFSKGDYIAFLDDDDVWLPNKIEKQIDYLERNKVDMVFCNGYRFYDGDFEKRDIYQRNFIGNRPITFFEELESDKIGSTSHPLIKRSAFAKAGLFDIEMPARQDYEMWLRLCKYCRVEGINDCLFFYRYHNGERITKSFKKEILSYNMLLSKYRLDYKKNKVATVNIFLIMAGVYIKNKKYFYVLIFLLRAFFVSPVIFFNFVFNHKKNNKKF